MTMEHTSPARRSSVAPVLIAVVVTAFALLHLVLGRDTGQRTVLAWVAVGAGLLVGLLGSLSHVGGRVLLAVAAVGAGAALLLGVTYL